MNYLTAEMNVLAASESYYSYSQNVFREMIYDPEKPIAKDKTSYEVVKETIEVLTIVNQQLMTEHFQFKSIEDETYQTNFKMIMEGNLC